MSPSVVGSDQNSVAEKLFCILIRLDKKSKSSKIPILVPSSESENKEKLNSKITETFSNCNWLAGLSVAEDKCQHQSHSHILTELDKTRLTT